NTTYRWSQAGGLSVFLKPSGLANPDPAKVREAGANGLFAGPGGTLLLADSGSRVVARMDLTTREKTTLASTFEGHRFNSPNDLALHSNGSVFFTDPPYGLVGLDDSPLKELRANGIYRIDTSGQVRLVDDGLSFPNGIALSPDERTLYVSNSDPARPVWMAYSLDAQGQVTGKRVFADASDLLGEGIAGLPDGMAVSREGFLFATAPGGVLVMDATGKRLGRIQTGSAVSNCAFGDDGKTLYLTSHTQLARVRVRVTGVGFSP
ncbi:MAG: SMP-30/gluconolactonase/LRE family protein, partial [Lysobacteraceae bacterium]